MHTGYNIKRIREIKGYSQKAIADKLGMSVTGYGIIERGTTDVKDKRLVQIARVLGITREDIQNFNPEVYFNTAGTQEPILNTNTITTAEKELYKTIIQHKDEEIAYLRSLLKRKFK